MHNLQKFKRQESEGVRINTFGYTGLIGPFNWAALEPENEACKTGSNQSPINLDDTISLATEAPVVDIPEQEAEFENLGTTLEVILNGTTSFAGSDFRLKQFHMHTPSEHRIGEEYFPLEIHMVHEGVADPNSLAVISVLFDIASTGEQGLDLLSALGPNIATIATPGTKTPVTGLPFEELIQHVQTTPLFTYTGSLTTPPCAEGLTFLITQQPMKIDVDTFNAIKKQIKFNSRYTQNALGGDNLIAIAQLAGTAEQLVPGEIPAAGLNATASASASATATAAPTFIDASDDAVVERPAATATPKAKEEKVVVDSKPAAHAPAPAPTKAKDVVVEAHAPAPKHAAVTPAVAEDKKVVEQKIKEQQAHQSLKIVTVTVTAAAGHY
jgi:carbonic anhydrase